MDTLVDTRRMLGIPQCEASTDIEAISYYGGDGLEVPSSLGELC